MPVQIQNTANLDSKQGVKCVCYGPSGIGKTRLCATAPRPLVFSCEAGLLSLRKSNTPYIEVSSYDALVDAYLWVMKSHEAKSFDTFCLDSVSEIGEVVLSGLRKKQKDPRKLYPEHQDDMISLFRAFRDMPNKHVYFVAKQEQDKDATGVIRFSPMMPGNKLKQQVPYFFDEVFQLCTFRAADGKDYLALRTQRDNLNDAKDRSGALDMYEPPDLTHVFNKIMRG